ncbi:MAG TPA: mechanosensitive ion channel domain-containing protein [archaeon]|nr:mechanosensitive ion channel domain-containing protein [archaeon]
MHTRFTVAYLIISFLLNFTQHTSLFSQVSLDTAAPAKETAVQKASEKSIVPLKETLQQTQPKIKWSISAGKVIWAAIIFFAAFLVFRYLTIFLEGIAERWSGLRLLIKRLIPIVRILGWTLVIYVIIASIFAPPIETLIAVTASVGIAVGFASQDILKNIFGGIMILFDRPFQVGDKIQVGAYYGEVVQIGLRTVRIVTPDDSLVSIPNSEIVNQSVSNSNSGEFNCQVVSEFYLPADIDLVKLKKIAYRSAAVSQYVYLNKPISVIIKNEVHQGRSLLKVRLKAYVLDLRYEFPFMSEMTEIVMNELLKQKVISAEDLDLVKANHAQ